MIAPYIILNNGQKMPKLGLGTWKTEPGETEEIVKIAIDAGYRHFDCATVYNNENEIGTAIRKKISDGTVTREDLFIVTKLWNTFHEKQNVVPACKKSLQNFGLDYVDQYLIHWPIAQKSKEALAELSLDNFIGIDYDYVETWKGMEECVQLGLTKGIGLSNFNSQQIDRILQNSKIKPVINQVEVTPLLNQKKLIQFCKDRDIYVTSYSPFGSPKSFWVKPSDPVVPLNDPKLISIGKKYGKTPAQVILRYLIEIGTVPIPKSANKKRLSENINIFDFKLSQEDIRIMDSFNCNARLLTSQEWTNMPHYPFAKNIEF
ncbi:hypothetical protein FQA39_LY00824 [Lamprigera yunnana]|nr:hypothetical protein FQA39_LY00824 [Lamprigera yunnana]